MVSILGVDTLISGLNFFSNEITKLIILTKLSFVVCYLMTLVIAKRQ
jgi:hypothetical protein